MIDIVAQETQSPGAASYLIFLLPIALLFFLMRSQRRRAQQQQQVQQGVDVGDEVLTSAGILGTVIDIDDEDILLVEIAPGTRVRMVRGGVARRINDLDDDLDDDADLDGDEEEATGAP